MKIQELLTKIQESAKLMQQLEKARTKARQLPYKIGESFTLC